jgi:hypothetical protein
VLCTAVLSRYHGPEDKSALTSIVWMGTDHHLAGHVAADIYGEPLAASSTSSPGDEKDPGEVDCATSALCRRLTDSGAWYGVVPERMYPMPR